MSQEIVYTSAPQGLKPGSQGFCTVVSTEGMARNLADRLESLSGYRHAYAVTDERSYLNPVNYSHVLISITGRPYHVLSRICDAGFDYSKRSNKLAHHVSLAESETLAAPGGPAWAMAQEGFFVTSWDGRTKIIASGRQPRHDDRPPSICAEWQRLAGDAGWGGALAESAENSASQPAYVIFAPGTDVLPLVVESLALLPADQRWKTTYSTYFTKAPAGVQIQWRFLLDGTQEASAQRRNPHVLLIDLCTELGQATGGPLVAAARSGKMPQAAAPAEPLSGSSARLRAWTAHGKIPSAPSTRAGYPATLPPILPPQQPSVALDARGIDSRRYSRHRPSRGLRKLALGLAALLLAVGLITIGVLAGMRFSPPGVAQGEANPEKSAVPETDKHQATPRGNTPQPHSDDTADEQRTKPDKTVPVAYDPPLATSRVEPGSGTSGQQLARDSQHVTNDIQQKKVRDGNGTVTSEAPDSVAGAKAVPSASAQQSPQAATDVIPFQRVALPKLIANSLEQVNTEPQRLELQSLVSRDVQTSGGPTLKLVGDPLQLLNENEQLSLKWDAGSSSWQVEYDTLDGSYLGNRAVGSFIMDGEGLAYQWEPNIGRGIDTCLRWSLLDITGQESTKRYLLNSVVRSQPIEIQKKNGFKADAIVLDFAGRRPGAELFADVSLTNAPADKVENAFRIPIDGEARFHFHLNTGNDGRLERSSFLRTVFHKIRDGEKYGLSVDLYYWPISGVDDNGAMLFEEQPRRFNPSTQGRASSELAHQWKVQTEIVKEAWVKITEQWKTLAGKLDEKSRDEYRELSRADFRNAQEIEQFRSWLRPMVENMRESEENAQRGVSWIQNDLEAARSRGDPPKDISDLELKLQKERVRLNKLSDTNRVIADVETTLDTALKTNRRIELVKKIQARFMDKVRKIGERQLLYRVYADVDGETVTIVETDPSPPVPPPGGGA